MNEAGTGQATTLLSRRLIALCVGLPVVIVAIDHVFESPVAQRYVGYAPHHLVHPLQLFYAWMVLKVALVSWCAGRYVRPPALCWAVFVWSLLLITFSTYAREIGSSSEFQHLLLSALLGLVICYSILAAVPWVWRLPIAVVAVALLILSCGPLLFRWTGESWILLFGLSTLAQIVICAALRWCRYQLARPSELIAADDGTRVMQFGTNHLMIWSAAIAPLLVVIRLTEALRYLSLNVAQSELPHAVTIGATFALLNLIAIWIALADAKLWQRLVVTVIGITVCGASLEFVNRLLEEQLKGNWTNLWRRFPLAMSLRDMPSQWWLWSSFATGLLAALLLFFRGRGYRLVRRV